MGIGRSAFYDTPDARARDLSIVVEMKTICDFDLECLHEALGLGGLIGTLVSDALFNLLSNMA